MGRHRTHGCYEAGRSCRATTTGVEELVESELVAWAAGAGGGVGGGGCGD